METAKNVTLAQILPELRDSEVDVTIRVTSKLNVTAFAARQKVSGFVLSQVGTGVGTDEPELLVSRNRLLWRVQLFLALPRLGRLGDIGTVDVDAQTGEVLADDTTIEAMIVNARRLAPDTTH